MTPSAMMLALGAILILISVVGFMTFYWREDREDQEIPEQEDSIREVTDSMDEAEDYMRRIERLSRKEIDKTNDKKR